MFPCRHFSSAGKPKWSTCVSILYDSVDVNIESEVFFRNHEGTSTINWVFFLCASSLSLWQGHKAHFSVIEPTLVYVTTDRSALQARVRLKERFDRYMYLLLSCDTMSHYIVMLSQEERKWNALKLCGKRACVCPRACTWARVCKWWGFRRKVSKYESIWPRACICVWSWYQLGLKCLNFGTYQFLIIVHVGSICEQFHPKCIKWFCETGITIPHFRHQTPC